MRVILKPAGLLIILGAFSALILIVFFLTNQMKKGGSAGGVATASAPALTATLSNMSFEGDYTPVIIYDTKARLTGVVANGWKDDSSWAQVEVAYSKDETTGNAHSGKACQRIDIKKVDRVTDKTSVVQFNQALQLKQGANYRGSFYLKADKPTEVEISIRQVDWPYHYYGAKVLQVGTTWTQANVEAPISEVPKAYLMVKVWTPGTLWVDDAAFQELSAGGSK